ncbi:MAG: CGNR zinc finger domain-containing protein [Actinomycetota bacterium]
MTSKVRKPSAAPGQLDLVRRFVNTLDLDTGTDELASPAAASAWLREQGWRTRVGAAGLIELLEAREALRDLMGARGVAPLEAEAAVALDAIARRHPLLVQISSPDPLQPISKAGVGALLERILGLVVAARIDGSWERMKTCANDECRWLFYDHSRNRSRTWCTMDICGAEAKMRAYRRRRAAGRAPRAPSRKQP